MFIPSTGKRPTYRARYLPMSLPTSRNWPIRGPKVLPCRCYCCWIPCLLLGTVAKKEPRLQVAGCMGSMGCSLKMTSSD